MTVEDELAKKFREWLCDNHPEHPPLLFEAVMYGYQAGLERAVEIVKTKECFYKCEQDIAKAIEQEMQGGDDE